MRINFSVLNILVLIAAVAVFGQKPGAVRSVSVESGPDARVWLDGVLRGITDENGKLTIKPVSKGIHTIRIRAFGFKEINQRVTALQQVVKAPLVKTFDRAEIAFQNAEKSLSENKYKSIDLYRDAIRISPRYAAAHLGLTRALADTGDYDAARTAVRNARRIQPVFPELSAVEGRIFRSDGDIDKAIESFERAIHEGKGFQPEAHTGLALIFKDEAEAAAARGDYEEESLYYAEAAKSFESAIDQLSATEPVVYLLLGQVYEKMDEKEKAIRVYERFLSDMPGHEERTAVESFIEQLKKRDQF